MQTRPVSRFAFARYREIEHGRVTLSGIPAPLDGKPCIIFSCSLQPGRHPVEAVLATSAVRNPPPPGLIRHASIIGEDPSQLIVINVFESYAALANALRRAPNPAMAKLKEILEVGAELWVGPVACIPSCRIPRHAVVRALVHGADSITCPPRRADGEGPHLADAVFGNDSRPQMEALFAKRYWRSAMVNWYAGEPYTAVSSGLVHASEVEPVRFEMAPGVAASADAAAGAAQHKGDRGYGARQYTYQHRPHDPPVERPPPSTSAADLQASSSSVLRLHSEEEGVKAAAAVLRNQQAFVDLGWQPAKKPSSTAPLLDPTLAPPPAAGNDNSPSASVSITDVAPYEDVLLSNTQEDTFAGTSTAERHRPPLVADAVPPAPTAAAAVKKPQPQCAKVLCAGQKQLQCYVDQRLVLAPEPGDIVVIGPPPTPPGASSVTGDECTASNATAAAVAAARVHGAETVVLGRVVGVSRWSRGKAGPGQRYHAALRRACIRDVVDADVTANVETAAVAKLRAQLPRGALLRIFQTRLNASDPAQLTLAEAAPGIAGGPSAEEFRAAVAAATGASRRHVFRIVPPD